MRTYGILPLHLKVIYTGLRNLNFSGRLGARSFIKTKTSQTIQCIDLTTEKSKKLRSKRHRDRGNGRGGITCV